MLKPEHIRFAQTNQLARLLKTSHTKVSQWVHRRSFNDSSLDEAVKVGVPKEVLVSGIELRRQDAALARSYQQELEEFLASSEGGEVA